MVEAKWVFLHLFLWQKKRITIKWEKKRLETRIENKNEIIAFTGNFQNIEIMYWIWMCLCLCLCVLILIFLIEFKYINGLMIFGFVNVKISRIKLSFIKQDCVHVSMCPCVWVWINFLYNLLIDYLLNKLARSGKKMLFIKWMCIEF